MDNNDVAKRLEVLNTYPISQWAYPRILVGIPLERAISYADKVFFRFMGISQWGLRLIDRPYMRIDTYRNMAVLDLLQSDCTHLLMLDVDHQHPIDIVQRLAKWPIMFPEVRVLSGLNFRRQKPFDPVMGNLTSVERPIMTEWQQGLMRVDEIGAASLLVHRSVFEEIEPPWFYNDYSGVMEHSWPGEDIGFSRKCRDNGIPIYVDTTTSSPHCREELTTEETFRNYLANNPANFRDAEYV